MDTGLQATLFSASFPRRRENEVVGRSFEVRPSSVFWFTTRGPRLRGDDGLSSRNSIDELLHGKLVTWKRIHRDIAVPQFRKQH